MPSYIQHIETSVPPFSYRQDDLREELKDILQGSTKENRLIHSLFSRSGITRRHSVLRDFRGQASGTLFFNGDGKTPGTRSRNDTYIREGRKLFVDVARKLTERSGYQSPDITHLITVSCTGFYAPGPDFDIIRALGLDASVERYHLGFMGCYASVPALKLADQICRANPWAVVMIISVELCSLHFQATLRMDDLISASVFADGGAGALVSGRKPASPAFRVSAFASSIAPEGAEDMAWSIGNTGFEMVLSKYIPGLLSKGLKPFLRPLLKKFELTPANIGHWAVHPGGRAILDNVEKTLDLPGRALAASRNILSRYGNMSSATLLFVLKELLVQPSEMQKKRTLALAFGPGLTMESALLDRIE